MKAITIAGNIGRDAETRQAGNGTVTGFSVAVSGRRREDASTWFDVAIWGARGEKLAPYLKKGGKVCVSGEFSAHENNGKTYLKVNASEITLMGSRQDAGEQYREKQPTGGSGALDDEIPFAPEFRA